MFYIDCQGYKNFSPPLGNYSGN